METTTIDNKILMPINKDFLEVFEIFMDDNQKEKIRANNVRQYVEGIIDLLLKDKILPVLKQNELYEGVNWKRKIKIIQENYDRQIAEKIQKFFRIGGDGSHFSGKVSDEELQSIIDMAIHIVEDIFVNYFLVPEHEFGRENIFTIFSMLPLKHRIYILEKISTHYNNKHIVDRLSLAYVKNGEEDKAKDLLNKSLNDKIIDKIFYEQKLISLNAVRVNIEELYKQNADYEKNPEYSKAIVDGSLLVVGLSTSKDIFDTAKAMQIFSGWFENAKSDYPEFINLFFYLMQTDNRSYKQIEE